MKKFDNSYLTKQEKTLLLIRNLFGLNLMCKFKYCLGYLIGYKNKKLQLKKLYSINYINKYDNWKAKAKLIIKQSNDKLLYDMIDSYFSSDIEKIKDNNLSIDKNDVIVVCALKNELTRIKEFMSYYRKLGVKLFLICDNNSTDGSTEYLEAQQDIVLYKTTDEYNSQKKCAWCNRMISDYGDDRWYLIVDADELIWYPESNCLNINEYANQLYKKGIYSVKGLMLEMYPKGLLGDSRLKKENYINEYTYYDVDNDYYVYDNNRMLITGGFLNRIFNDENILQSKVPLFYQTSNRFNIGSHHIFPFKEDITAKFGIVLKHYKFLPGDENRIREIIKLKNYANSSRLYKKFITLYNNEGINPYSEFSRNWDEKTVLKNLNFIEELTHNERKG